MTAPLPIGERVKLEREYLLLQELRRREGELHITFRPYEKQLEFYNYGRGFAERAFFAGNQLGKTLAAAMETFYHLSGLYPDWWRGQRFDRPTVGWVGGDTGETIRDTSQRLLLDRPGKLDEPEYYIGIIPLRLLEGRPKMASGIPDLVDHFKVKHVTGGVSYCYFKAYAKGRKKWQGETIDFVWFDEEPEHEIYSEGLTRTNKGQRGQFSYLTFTPLLGMSDVVHMFLKNPSPQQTATTMTIHDVSHYTDAEKESIIRSYPEHEREARSLGLPFLGSGRVFPIEESAIREPYIIDVPNYWRQIGGLDFGWDHPAAAVRLLHDTENDVIHVRNAYRERQMTPLEFRHGILSWPEWLPFAWPHDGLQHDKGSGQQLAKQYKTAGLNMLEERATFEDGSNGVEAGVTEILDRMRTGRWKVDASLTNWFEEFRLYHRVDGVIVKKKDDLLDASRVAMMMRRHAITQLEAIIKDPETPTWMEKLIARGQLGNARPRGFMAS